MARDHLDVAAEREEEHEHRDRVEVDLAVAAHRVPDAGREREHDADADRHVHADAARPQGLQRACVERPSGVERHRDRDQHAHEPQQFADAGVHARRLADVERHGEHHHLHHAEAGDREPLQRRATLQDRELLGRLAGERVRPQADVLQHAQQVAEPHLRGIPHQARTRRGRVHAHVEHAALQVQRLVGEPAAGGAAHAFEQHGDGARAPGLGARQALDELRPVIGRPAIRPRGLVGAGRGRVPVRVVVVETGAGDELRDGLAAVAADRLLTAADVRVDHDPGGNRLAAVEAGRTRPGHGARCVSVSPHFMTTPSFTQSWRTSASGRVIAR